MIDVVLVDDQAMIRAGLRGILEDAGIRVIGEAADGRSAFAVIRSSRPDVVLMDLRMPILDGVGATAALRADPDLNAVRILVLTTFDGDEEVLAALRAGADGFLAKSADSESLIAAVEAVAKGDTSLSAGAAKTVVSDLRRRGRSATDVELIARTATLTHRETDVVLGAARGLDNDSIARNLFISPATVKTHLNRAMTKLHARDRGQLVSIAFRSGLVDRAEHP
ncbi:response regulator transcription factor [Clavibacter michiganensis subsp. michiganensis]|uniref:response regulator n=1 Tax=Clavibacter michiganensis TaxID=28447 RepID=UPI001FF12043|nr:response regulator transcription factor [Clavibacter michiganensis]UOW03810.1 response regulator transcription factor [Clavibacter michiganensis subsp. michiganensis]